MEHLQDVDGFYPQKQRILGKKKNFLKIKQN